MNFWKQKEIWPPGIMEFLLVYIMVINLSLVDFSGLFQEHVLFSVPSPGTMSRMVTMGRMEADMTQQSGCTNWNAYRSTWCTEEKHMLNATKWHRWYHCWTRSWSVFMIKSILSSSFFVLGKACHTVQVLQNPGCPFCLLLLWLLSGQHVLFTIHPILTRQNPVPWWTVG